MVDQLYLNVHSRDNDGRPQRTGVNLEAPHIPQLLAEEFGELSTKNPFNGWTQKGIEEYIRGCFAGRLDEFYAQQMKEMESQMKEMLADDPTSKLSTVRHAVVGIAYDIAEGVRMHVEKYGQEYVRQHGERIRAESKKEPT